MNNEESEAQVICPEHDHVLDGGVAGASRELAIDKDACGEVYLPPEGLIVELMREGCRRHRCGVCGHCGEPEGVLLGMGDYKARSGCE